MLYSLIAGGVSCLNSGSGEGVLGAGIGTIVSGALGKIPFLSNGFGDFATGLVSEGTGDNIGKAVSKNDENN